MHAKALYTRRTVQRGRHTPVGPALGPRGPQPRHDLRLSSQDYAPRGRPHFPRSSGVQVSVNPTLRLWRFWPRITRSVLHGLGGRRRPSRPRHAQPCGRSGLAARCVRAPRSGSRGVGRVRPALTERLVPGLWVTHFHAQQERIRPVLPSVPPALASRTLRRVGAAVSCCGLIFTPLVTNWPSFFFNILFIHS